MKEENGRLKEKIEDQSHNITQLEAVIQDLNQKLSKARYIINKASEGDASYIEEDDLQDDEDPKDLSHMEGNNMVVEPPAANSDGFKKKKKYRKIKLNKNEKEVEQFLESFSNTSAKIKFSKFTQTNVDPVLLLVDSKDKLPELNISTDDARQAIDILLKLIGYASLEQILKKPLPTQGLKPTKKPKIGSDNEQGKNSVSPKPKKFKNANEPEGRYDCLKASKDSQGKVKKQLQYSDEDSFEDDGQQDELDDPNLYPRLPPSKNDRKKNHSHSPNKV